MAVGHLWGGVRLRWFQDWSVSRGRADKLRPLPAVQGPGSAPLRPPHREPLGVPRPRGRLTALAVNGWCSSHLGSWGGLDLTRAPEACPCAKWVQLSGLRSKSLQSCRSQGPASWLTVFTSRLLSNTRSAKSFSSQSFQSNSGSVCLVGALHWRSRAVCPSETAPQLHRSREGSQWGRPTHTSPADAGRPVGCIVFLAEQPPPLSFFLLRVEPTPGTDFVNSVPHAPTLSQPRQNLV